MNFFTTFVSRKGLKAWLGRNISHFKTDMNILDIILIIILVVTGVSGFRKGLISQAFGIGGLLLGIWLGYRFSARIAGWFEMNDEYASLLAFVLILIMAIIATYFAGRLVKSVFRMTGFGILDNLGGLVLGVVKISLIVSLLLGLFVKFNKESKIVNPDFFEKSLIYKPMKALGDAVFPWILESTSRLFDNERGTQREHSESRTI